MVFSDIGLAFLREADPEFFGRFVAHHERCDYMEIVHQGTRVQVQGNHFSRTSRIDMLAVLEQACREAGVRIRHQQRIEDVARLAGEVDMVVAADGSNSAVRKQYAEHFRPAFERRRNKFAWYGTRQRFHPVSLIFREAEHGIFIAHSYQYSKDLSTFLVEVDPDSWRRAGLDTASDDSRRYCAEVFREDLGANELLGNRSLWFEANIVRNECWSHQNIVLLGDALRTVHFVARAPAWPCRTRSRCTRGCCNTRATRAPPSRYSRRSAARPRPTSRPPPRSLDWYENVADKMHLDPVDFAYDYMRRTGQVSHDDLRQRDPAFASAYEARHPVTA